MEDYSGVYLYHRVENYSAGYPTRWKIIPQGFPQWGKLFREVNHYGENYSARYTTMGKIIPQGIPLWGKLFRKVYHYGENYSARYTTMGKIIPQGITVWGKLFRGVSNNGEYTFCLISLRILKRNQNAGVTKRSRSCENVPLNISKPFLQEVPELYIFSSFAYLQK